MKKSMTQQLAEAKKKVQSSVDELFAAREEILRLVALNDAIEIKHEEAQTRLQEALKAGEDERKLLAADNDVFCNKVAELEKQLKASIQTKESNHDSWLALNRELEQLHQMLDAIPGVPERKINEDYNQRSVITRLAAWLATK